LNGNIDIYAEYSGNALTRILGEESRPDQYSVYDAAAAKYRDLGLVLLEPLPANNALGLVSLQATADAEKLKTYSDIQAKAGNFILAVTPEFRDDPEGYALLESVYGPFAFKEVRVIADDGELHMALHDKQVDLISISSDDGHLADPKHKLLRDNFHAFVAQTLTPVVKRSYIDQNEKIRNVLNPISASINDKKMIGLNNDVVNKQIPYPQAAKTYLKENNLIK
jgi:glycine betaine/choline ABC-type transport system substrate-binding protein